MQETEVRQHDWREMKVTPVTVLVTETEGITVVPRPDDSESETTVGCWKCNMGLSEGVTTPCPEGDLFEEFS